MQDLEMHRRTSEGDKTQVPGAKKDISQSMSKRIVVAIVPPRLGVAAPLLPQRANRSDIPRKGSREQHVEDLLVRQQM